MKDYVIRGIDKKGTINFFIASTTNLVEEARRIHNTSPTATAALGRVLTAACMIGMTLKNDRDTLTLKIKGDGPIGSIVSVANSKGEVKGYVENPQTEVPRRPDGKLNVGGAVGKNGQIAVIKDLGLKEPFIEYSNLVSGEIAEDLASYYYHSEQQPTAISLGVLVDTDTSVRAAGGFMIQLLPGVSEEDIDRIESILKSIKPMSTLIDEGLTPEEILKEIFGEFQVEVLDKTFVQYKCNCSMEKVESILVSLGNDELKAIIEEDGKAEVVCHFCNTKYNFSKEDLIKLLR
ncbi:MAG: Hsp33 family molecular chaperone HslO [Tissierellales bacterium]